MEAGTSHVRGSHRITHLALVGRGFDWKLPGSKWGGKCLVIPYRPGRRRQVSACSKSVQLSGTLTP